MQDYFMISECSNGALYDTRDKHWSSQPPLRPNYRVHHQEINSVADLKATLRAGPYAFPGGYPLFLNSRDNATLCFDCVRTKFKNVIIDFMNDFVAGWIIEGCGVNYESDDLYCAHCNKQIESAYGD